MTVSPQLADVREVSGAVLCLAVDEMLLSYSMDSHQPNPSAFASSLPATASSRINTAVVSAGATR